MKNKNFTTRTTIENVSSMLEVVEREDSNELQLSATYPQIATVLRAAKERMEHLETLRRDKTVYPEEG